MGSISTIQRGIHEAIFSVLLCLGFLSAAKAEIIDLSTRTCRQFQTSDPDESKIILAWLDAYYKDEDDPPVIHTDKLIANAKKLGEYARQIRPSV